MGEAEKGRIIIQCLEYSFGDKGINGMGKNKFRADTAGLITGKRFYKAAANTGTQSNEIKR